MDDLQARLKISGSNGVFVTTSIATVEPAQYDFDLIIGVPLRIPVTWYTEEEDVAAVTASRFVVRAQYDSASLLNITTLAVASSSPNIIIARTEAEIDTLVTAAGDSLALLYWMHATCSLYTDERCLLHGTMTLKGLL